MNYQKLFLNLVLCYFESFWLCMHKTYCFFLFSSNFVSTFNFQSSVGIKIGTWYFLTCCTSLFFFTFFNELLHKSICFRTVELHVVQLIVILFHLTALTDLILHYFNLFYYQIGLFFSYIIVICWTQRKNHKIQITAKKNFKIRYFINIFY